MNNKAVFKDFTKYVSLNVLGMICISCYILADTFFIALALGSNGLAALNVSIVVFSLLFGFGLMVGIGGATLYSLLKSSGRDKDAESVFTHSLIIGLCGTAVFVLAGFMFTEHMAKAFGADDETLPLAAVYMRTILYFSPAFILFSVLGAFIRNDNNPKLAMAGMLVGSASNILLDYIFLFHLSMGMFGASLASGLSFALGVCVLSIHFWGRNNRLRLCKRKISVKRVSKIFILGSSAMINELAFAVTLITFNLVIWGIEGNTGVAAFGIVANIAFVSISMFTGVAQGIQPLISRGHGSGGSALVRLTLKYAMVSVFLLAISIYIISYLNAAAIAEAFNSEANVRLSKLAVDGLKIYFAGFAFAGLNIVAASFFSAIGNAKSALVLSLLRGCVIIVPMVIVLSTVLKMDGVWLSFVITELIVFALSVIFFVKKFREPKFKKPYR